MAHIVLGSECAGWSALPVIKAMQESDVISLGVSIWSSILWILLGCMYTKRRGRRDS